MTLGTQIVHSLGDGLVLPEGVDVDSGALLREHEVIPCLGDLPPQEPPVRAIVEMFGRGASLFGLYQEQPVVVPHSVQTLQVPFFTILELLQEGQMSP